MCIKWKGGFNTNYLKEKTEVYDSESFNFMFKTRVRKNMKVEEVLTQLKHTALKCGFVETNEESAKGKLLLSNREYIIDIDN